MRADKFISQKFGFSRNKIQQFIDAGLIFVNEKKLAKMSQNIDESDKIEILDDKKTTWVSRSAEKLFWFFENPSFAHLKQEIVDSICLDVGSSTGGFTQVLLDFGAQKVDAVDVWTDQLSSIIRKNPQVFSYENTDIRDFKTSEKYDFIVCDASFISLEKIFPAIYNLADMETEIILLFKPQFEVGREFLNKKWVPKNEKIIIESLEKFKEFVSKNCKILSIQKSTLIGEAGNQEYVFYIKKSQ